jgi:23S rRNA pseudouridine2605 synthase
MLLRLQKVLAEAGVASRRASEEIVRAGRVAVNRQVVREVGVKVDPQHDRITVDGTVVKPKRKLYVALHKPPGYVCSRNDPYRRPTVGELLPLEWKNLYPVGRLDYDSEGLIFLTNDGEFSLRLTHPRYGVCKLYQVTVEGRVEFPVLKQLTKGLLHQGEKLKAERARLIHANQSHSLVELELSEGKKREVRRLFAAQGFTVTRLKRIQIGPIKLGELPRGRWRTLAPGEIASLLGKTRASTGTAGAKH